jgi:hypothetical protein
MSGAKPVELDKLGLIDLAGNPGPQRIDVVGRAVRRHRHRHDVAGRELKRRGRRFHGSADRRGLGVGRRDKIVRR